MFYLVLTLDVMDVAGEHQSDITHSVYKVQLAPDGTEIKRERSPSMLLTIAARVDGEAVLESCPLIANSSMPFLVMPFDLSN
jgi:hypothetical protein